MVTTQRLAEAWQARAACRGPQAAVFFPPTHAERKEDKLARESRPRRSAGRAPYRGLASSTRYASASPTVFGAG